MSKGELIAAIRQHNRTVSPKFLERFGEEDLKAYLQRICRTLDMPPPPKMRATVDGQEALVVA